MAYLFIVIMKINTSTCVKKLCQGYHTCVKHIPFLIVNIFFPFLFPSCPQGNQLRGIRGLFKRSSKYSIDTNSGGLRKRSISDHLLRRTASAPAKGRKKTKMALSESVALISDQKNGTDAGTRNEGMSGKEGGVEKRLQPRAPLTHRPISMPLDRLLQGQLSICSPEKEQHDMGADSVIGRYFIFDPIQRFEYILECWKLHHNYIHFDLIYNLHL